MDLAARAGELTLGYSSGVRRPSCVLACPYARGRQAHAHDPCRVSVSHRRGGYTSGLLMRGLGESHRTWPGGPLNIQLCLPDPARTALQEVTESSPQTIGKFPTCHVTSEGHHWASLLVSHYLHAYFPSPNSLVRSH